MKTVLAHTNRLARGGLRRFGGSALLVALGRLAFLAFFAVAARFSSVTQFGEFATSLALAQILAIAATLGTAPAAQAILPAAMGRRNGRLADIFIRFSLTMTLLATLGFGLVLLLIGIAADQLDIPGGLGTMTLGACYLLPGIAFGTLREFLARSTGHTTLALLPRDVVWTVACMAALIASPTFGDNLVVGCAVLLATIEVGATAILLRRLGRWPLRKAPLRFFKQWRRRSLALMLNNTGGLLLDRFDIFIVGLLFPLDAAAVYSVANRLAPLASLSQRFVVPVQIAKISLAMARRDVTQVWLEVRTGLLAGAAFTLCVLLLFSFGNQPILGLYGDHYLQAAQILLILSVGQSATALGSNFGMVASIGHRKWTFAIIIWLVVLPGGLLAYMAGLWFGMMGVAIAAAVTLITYNFALAQVARITLADLGNSPAGSP